MHVYALWLRGWSLVTCASGVIDVERSNTLFGGSGHRESRTLVFVYWCCLTYACEISVLVLTVRIDQHIGESLVVVVA